ncbi:MAG: hypothetical protein ACLRMZ_06450 [Blautia marasmi]
MIHLTEEEQEILDGKQESFARLLWKISCSMPGSWGRKNSVK